MGNEERKRLSIMVYVDGGEVAGQIATATERFILTTFGSHKPNVEYKVRAAGPYNDRVES